MVQLCAIGWLEDKLSPEVLDLSGWRITGVIGKVEVDLATRDSLFLEASSGTVLQVS